MSEASGGKPHITFVRAPLISRDGAFNNEIVPSLGIAYVAGYVRQFGYPTELVDGAAMGLNQVHPLPGHPGFQIQGAPLEQLVAAIPAHTQVIGVSCMFSAEWVLVREMILKIRARFPSQLIVGGGEHFTALAEYSLRDCPALDVIVKGEGEHTFYELLEGYADSNWDAVDGIAFLAPSGEFRNNGGLPRMRDAKRVPWPWWPEGYLEAFWAAGKSYGVRTGRDMPMLATRGCPYQCTFCSSPQMWTTRYVQRDVDDVIAEIQHYVEKYNITSLQLYDLTAFVKRDFTIEFCTKLKAAGIRLRWSLPSGTRSEALDEEVLALLKETGCDYLAYAPESGSQRSLKKIKKRVHLDRMVASIRKARAQGIVLRTNLIIGFPHETRRDVFATLFFGLKMAILGVDEVPYFIFSAYPGTEIFRELEAAGRVKLGDEYFMQLVSFNGKFSNLRPRGVTNLNMSPWELASLRLLFMLTNYAVAYLLRPQRIWRTLRNLVTGEASATVLENRLQNALHRREADPRAASR
jgi:anaerobic magnesium-protoporphyrin IX monomethyl ester cyclase